MIEKMIIDADLCIKLGGSIKYRFLYDILPLVASNIYMHTWAHGEVMMPASAVSQLKELISDGKVILINENGLDAKARVVFDASRRNLEKVMLDPRKPNKNRGEICSLAYAKATGIPIFATDEKDIQPIIDSQLNTGIDDITCVRIVDIVLKAYAGEINISRKLCKALWIIAGKKKEIFDKKIWPVNV